MASARQTTYTLTLGQLIAGICFIIVGVWAVAALTLSITFGGVNDDIEAIRASIAGEPVATTDGETLAAETATIDTGDAEATGSVEPPQDQIERLTTELAATNARLANLIAAMSQMDASMKSVDTKLTQSITRQNSFERWTMTRLGSPVNPGSLPDGWFTQQVDILNQIKGGTEPLADWLKAAE